MYSFSCIREDKNILTEKNPFENINYVHIYAGNNLISNNLVLKNQH